MKRVWSFFTSATSREEYLNIMCEILQQGLQLSNQIKWPYKAYPLFVAEITLEIKAEIGDSKLKTKALFA